MTLIRIGTFEVDPVTRTVLREGIRLERTVRELSQARYMYVDYVVQGSGPSRFLPHISRQHFAENNSAFVPREVFEQLL
jgi:hypothetical protein